MAKVSVTPNIVTENQIVLSDVTTDDVSTTAHGFVPKAPNNTYQVLDGTGAWVYPKTIAFRATYSQSVANGAFETAEASSENYDYGSNYNTGTYTFTAPVKGLYLIIGRAQCSNIGDTNQLIVQMIGSTIGTVLLERSFGAAASNDPSISPATVWELQASETLYMQVYQNSGGAITVAGEFSATLLYRTA